MTKNINDRKSGIELLRIISILFVIIIHLLPQFVHDPIWFNLINSFVFPAIFCYAFITGYFILNSNKDNKFLTLLKFSIEFIVWRILISFISIFIEYLFITKNPEILKIEIGDLIHGFFNYRFWYFWAILIVYLLFVFINNFFITNYIKAKKYYFYLFYFFIGLIVITNILGYIELFQIYHDQYSFLVVLIAAMFGGVWQIIEKEKQLNYNIKTLLIGLAIISICFISNFSIATFTKYRNNIFDYYNIFLYLSGFGYFLFFQSLKFQSKIINYLAFQSWGIYILHNGFNLPRGWTVKIFKKFGIANLKFFVLAIIFCYVTSLLLTISCSFINEYIKSYFKKSIIKKIKN